MPSPAATPSRSLAALSTAALGHLARRPLGAAALGASALVCATYVAVAHASYAFVIPPSKNAVFWLPSGIVVGLFLRASHVPQVWPPWLLAAFTGELVIALTKGVPLAPSLAWSLANVLLALSAALLARRLSPEPFGLRRISDVGRLAVVTGLAVIPGALVAAAAGVIWLGVPSFGEMAISWALSDALGVVLLAPVLLAWTSTTPRLRGRALELALMVATMTLVALVLALSPSRRDPTVPLLLCLVTVWAAVRFGPALCSAGLLVLDLVLVEAAAHGRGLYGLPATATPAELLGLQLTVGAIGLLTLVLAAAIEEQRDARLAVEGALERAEQLSVERQRVEEEARFLADVSRSLATSIDYQATLDQAAQLTIPRLADICLVDVIEDGQLQQSVVAYADPSQAAFWEEFPGTRHGPDSPALAARAYREGSPILIADVTEPVIDDHSVDAQHRAAIRRLGLTSALALPLVAHQQRLGVMVLMRNRNPVRYGPASLALGEEIARRIAVAIINARLYRDAQRALLDRERLVEERTAELAAANRELATANSELEAFSYTVSHDLRAPLRHIHGFAEVLEERLGGPEDAALVARIKQAGGAMSQLIESLLQLSRLGRASLRRRPVSLVELVRTAREELAADQAGRVIDWHVGRLPELELDPGLAQLVITNLLANAIKFTTGVARAEIHVDCLDPLAEAPVMFVRDNGAGFPPEGAARLFSPFQRLHRQADFPGTGIGLANVRRIVERHGGRVWAEGQVGQGATFYFTFGPRPARSEA